MLQIKVKYKKGEEIKFVSHKDLMRAFQRTIQRAKLPIAYSQGFNPHMKISWGNALKVGATSDEQYATLQFETWIKPAEVMQKFNQERPPGLEILEAFVV